MRCPAPLLLSCPADQCGSSYEQSCSRGPIFGRESEPTVAKPREKHNSLFRVKKRVAIRKPITGEELAAIKQSVRDAKIAIQFWRKGLRKYTEAESNFAEIVHDKETLLRALRFDLGQESYPLNSPVVRDIVQHALENSDRDFFVRFGRLLASVPVPWGRAGKPNSLEKFLLDHWAVRKDGLPELYYLNADGLACVCTHVLRPKAGEADDYTADALVKVRQRLGLLPFKRSKIKVIRIGDRLKFPEVDN